MKFYVVASCFSAMIMLLLVNVFPADWLIVPMTVLGMLACLAYLMYIFGGAETEYGPSLVWHPPVLCVLTTAAYFCISSWSWLVLFLILGSLIAYALHRIVISEFPMQRSYRFLCTGAALCATIFFALVTQYPK